MTTRDTARNLELATAVLTQCWDPPRPDRLRAFTTDDRVVARFSAFAAAFPDARLHVRWTVADERRVVLGGRLTATHGGAWRGLDATNLPIDVACTITLDVEDGQVVDARTVADTLTLAEQIGTVLRRSPPRDEPPRPTGGAH